MARKTCLVEECEHHRWGKGYCKFHQNLRTDKQKPKRIRKKDSGLSFTTRQRKPTGELKIFEEIWKERPHVCYVSGEPIKEFSVMCMAHVLSKGGYPDWRLKKKNIVLLTASNHKLYDHSTHLAKKLPMFDKLFDLHEEYKQEYYRSKQIPKFD
jgi:hypothetical protein